MPDLDEEFERESTQATSSLAMRFLYSMPLKVGPARNDLGLSEGARAAKAAAAEADAQARADREAVRAAWERYEAGRGPEPSGVDGHVAGDVAFRTLAAQSAGEAAAISSVLAEHGIEHYASVGGMLDARPGSDGAAGYAAGEISEFEFERAGRAESGLYEVYAPDREAEEFFAPAEYPYQMVVGSPQGYTLLESLSGGRLGADGAMIREFLDEHDIEAVRARLALGEACGQARERVLWGEGLEPAAEVLDELGLVHMSPQLTFTLEVETVPWDAEATVVTDALSQLDVPFVTTVVEKAEGHARGIAHITVCEPHVGYAKQVVDELSSSVRGFSRERVLNYGQLASAAFGGVGAGLHGMDRAFRSAPLPFDQMHKVTCALQEMRIEHEVIEAPEEGTFEVVVMEGEVRDKGFRINRAAEILEAMDPPEAKAEAQRAYERGAQACESRERNARRVEGARERGEAAPQRQRGAKVSRDVKEATRSAEAQRRAAADVQRRKTLGL